MPTTRVIGLPELRARLEALKPNAKLMALLAERAIAEQARLAPVATGNLRRSIHVGTVSAKVAETVAGASYAAFVEDGTRGGQEIRPVRARALRWAANRGAARLSGAPRTSGLGSAVVFAKRVIRGATRAQPFMMPGAIAAVAGLKDIIISRWNGAA
jgi:hypothetical protein